MRHLFFPVLEKVLANPGAIFQFYLIFDLSDQNSYADVARKLEAEIGEEGGLTCVRTHVRKEVILL